MKDEIATFTIAVAAEAGEFAGGGKPGGRRRQRGEFRAGSDDHEFERIVFEKPVAKRGARLHGDEPLPLLDATRIIEPITAFGVEDLVGGRGATPEGALKNRGVVALKRQATGIRLGHGDGGRRRCGRGRHDARTRKHPNDRRTDTQQGKHRGNHREAKFHDELT